MLSEFRNPLFQDGLCIFLNGGENDAHPGVRAYIGYSAEGGERLAFVDNPDPDFSSRWQRFRCFDLATEQTQITDLIDGLRFRLQIGHFDVGDERKSARSGAVGLHGFLLYHDENRDGR
jgi:hypothetical protein